MIDHLQQTTDQQSCDLVAITTDTTAGLMDSSWKNI